MDPLSISASSIAIFGLAKSLICGTRSFYKDIKDAPKHIAEFIQELENFEVVLKCLVDTVKKTEENDEQYNDQTGENPGVTTTGTSDGRKKASRLPTVQKLMQTDGPLFLCYEKLLGFETRLQRRDHSRLRKSVQWPFEKTEIQAITRRLGNLKTDLNMAINADLVGLAIQFQGELRNAADTDAKVRESAANEALVSKVSDWLSPPNASTNLETARNKRQADTGNWLLESQVFIDWKTAGHSFFWLQGKAGSGKTILSSTVIHSLFDPSTPKSVVLYYYFDFQAREKQTVHNFLKHCVVQLSNANALTIQLVEKLYESHSEGRQLPTIKDLSEVIHRLIDVCPVVYLVIDALDECQERDSLLEFLVELQSWSQPNLHVFATSRQETDIEDSLEATVTHTIPLAESAVAGDILFYVEHQLQYDQKLRKWPQDKRDEIKTALLEGANGMFRWVECQLDAIRKCIKLAQLKNTLNSLPKTLHDTYARILDSVEEDFVEDVYRILSCLVCAFRPMSTKQFAEIVPIVSQGEVYYDIENRLLEPRHVLTMCSGLVTTTKSSEARIRGSDVEEVRLAHFSVKEYLVADRIVRKETSKFHIEERLAHEVLAKLSVRYLIYCHQAKFCDDPDFLQTDGNYLDKAAFAPYAAWFWSSHLQAARLDGSSPIYGDCLDMFADSVLLGDAVKLCRLGHLGNNDHSIMTYCGYLNPEAPNRPYYSDFKSVPPLYYASLLGLDHMVSLLLGKGEDPNCSTREGTCLAAAVAHNHQSTVELLLASGADVNFIVLQIDAEDDPCYTKTAIFEAVHHGYESIIKVLLTAGANVNIARWPLEPTDITDRSHANTPLQAAVYNTNRELVQVMLDAGADPNVHGGYYGTALESIAMHADDNAIMAMLLHAGADPNLTSISSGIQTPLFRTLLFGNRTNTYLLVKSGVDRYTIDDRVVTYAFYNWFTEETKLEYILETIIQIRPDSNFNAALTFSAGYCLIRIMKLLLKAGTTPNAQENSGLAALHAAAFTPGCSIEAVQVLLEADADICLHGGPLGSALQAAALSGKADVLSLLLDKGASVNHAEGIFGSALTIARLRLQDQQMACPEIWMGKVTADIQNSGSPNGYLYEFDDVMAPSPRDLALAKSPKDPTYEAKINIAHLPYADYQAIIDLLLSHGAIDDGAANT